MTKAKLHSTFIWIFILQLINFILAYAVKDNLISYPYKNHLGIIYPLHFLFNNNLKVAIFVIIMWVLIHCALGIIGSFLWHHRKHPKVKSLWYLFLLLLILNWLWQPLMNSKVSDLLSIFGSIIVLMLINMLAIIIMITSYNNGLRIITLWMIPFISFYILPPLILILIIVIGH